MMTRDDILNMEAGRELDALVSKEFDLLHYYACGDFFPSSDIAAAWQVVEKFKGQVTIQGPLSVGFNEGEDYPNYWTVGFTDRAWDDINGEADTLPLAICRARLLAKMLP
jgi:hypothetical protein